MSWFFFPRMLSTVMTILILIVLTRVLLPADFGSYNVTILSGTVAYALTFAWLATSIARFHRDPEFEGRSTASILGALSVLAIVVLPVAVACYFLLPSTYAEAVLYGGIFSLAHGMHETGLSGLRVLNSGPKFAAVTLLRPAIGVSLALWFVSNGDGFKGAVLGLALGAFVTGTYAIFEIARKTGVHLPDARMLKRYFVFGKPLAIVMSGSMLFLLTSQSLLAAMVGLEAVGFFAAAQTLAMRSVRLPMANLSRTMAASIFQEFEENGRDGARSMLFLHFSFLVLMALPISIILVFADSTVAGMLFDPPFNSEVARNLQLLGITAFLLGMQGAYFSYAFTLAHKTAIQLAIMAGMLIVHLVLTWGSIHLFGSIGASVGFIASSIVSLSVFIIVGRMVYPLEIPFSEIRAAGSAGLVFVPFALMADMIASPAVSALVILIGLVAFGLMLVRQDQIAAGIVIRKMGRFVVRRRGAGTSPAVEQSD